MTTLGDVILGGQQLADRGASGGPILTPEWISYANRALQELYGVLTSTYEDYNVNAYDFTLAGGSITGNQLPVGPGTAVPDFFQPRALWLNSSGIGPTPFVTITRLPSLNEQNLYSFPSIVPLYGAVPSHWNLLGSNIQIIPVNITSLTYRLLYVPTLPQFTDTQQPLDKYWLTVNGWHEYAMIDVAIKALIKEESLDTAALLEQKKQAQLTRILKECCPRDVSEPRAIVDMKRVRFAWPGWGAGNIGWDTSGGDGNW